MTPRLKERYLDEVKPELIERFGYKSPMQAPRLEKITLNMGVGDAKLDSKLLDAAAEQLATIAGQKPASAVRASRSRTSSCGGNAGGRQGHAAGDRMWEMLDRLESIAIPRIRDFRGLNPRSFDGRGNYSMGIREQIIFPEIDYDAIDQVRGLDVTITTTAATDEEAFELLTLLGLPFRARRPISAGPARGATAAATRSALRPIGPAEEPDRGGARRGGAHRRGAHRGGADRGAGPAPRSPRQRNRRPRSRLRRKAARGASAEEPAGRPQQPDQPEAEEAGEPDTET